jgi:predicted GNAT superfamily acetyltransferase
MKELDKIIRVKGKRFLFKVDKSSDASDYTKYEKLRYDIWGEPADTLPGKRNMVCENFFHEGSVLFIAVYVEDAQGKFVEDENHFIGFSYGFVGVEDKDVAFRGLDNLLFYSQYVGVREDFQKYNLGIQVKEFQKECLMEVFGVFKVTCTYDPLTGVNAYRNIHHFQMEVKEYRESCYSLFGGYLNRTDVPCDRFSLLWNLKREVRRPDYDAESLLASKNLVLSSRRVEVEGRSGQMPLEVVKDINLDLNREFLLVEIPYDFYRMLRETDVTQAEVRDIPLRWRMKSREVFQTLFKRGYKIIDFRAIEREGRKRDFYILKIEK